MIEAARQKGLLSARLVLFRWYVTSAPFQNARVCSLAKALRALLTAMNPLYPPPLGMFELSSGGGIEYNNITQVGCGAVEATTGAVLRTTPLNIKIASLLLALPGFLNRLDDVLNANTYQVSATAASCI